MFLTTFWSQSYRKFPVLVIIDFPASYRQLNAGNVVLTAGPFAHAHNLAQYILGKGRQ